MLAQLPYQEGNDCIAEGREPRRQRVVLATKRDGFVEVAVL